jgi:hypothetical protein
MNYRFTPKMISNFSPTNDRFGAKDSFRFQSIKYRYVPFAAVNG